MLKEPSLTAYRVAGNMASADGNPQIYNSLMTYHRYGYALYHPEASLVLKPGVCGYIDGDGEWHTMVDILAINNDPPEDAGGAAGSPQDAGRVAGSPQDTAGVTGSQNPQYVALNKTSILREKKSLCGPIITETVESTSFGIGAETTLPPGIPAEASAIAEFTLNSDFGALLLCKGLVTKNSFNGLDPFREWAKANFGKLLAEFPIIRTYGFYVVTSTWKAKEVFIKSWRKKGHKLSVGFSGGVESVAQISASTQIYGASRANGWNIPVWEGDEESVVFFGGLQYSYRTRVGWMMQNKHKFKEGLPGAWRGEDDIEQDPEAEDNAIEISEALLDDKGKF
ncbi:hypothetical protein F4803DRAFT_512294 [Xylaria telfairii]|nr:hypothetical protein F4803DRAFT_512294 [Xylaria telfairii]